MSLNIKSNLHVDPIVVDLDGTLIYTDCLYEKLNKAILFHPLIFIKSLWHLLQGKAKFKKFLSQSVSLDVKLLPYNHELIKWLKEEKDKGRKLILATASNEVIAKKIADHLGLFDKIYASDNIINLKGESKAQLLNKTFGNYEYVGNSIDDFPIWENAVKSHYVGSSSKLINKLKKKNNFDRLFPSSNFRINNLFRALRPHQWLKNILIFVPVVMAHQLSFSNLVYIFVAFFIFCSIASTGYIINDLSDLDADRLNKHKSKRPFASGDIILFWGWITIPILLMLSLLISINFFPFNFTLLVLLYLILTVFYTKKLKNLPIIDVFALAFLYIFRIIAGGFAVNIDLSFWLIAFSFFFFISLGMLKRYTELIELVEFSDNIPGRGYKKSDLSFVGSAGIASAYIAIAVFALYIRDLNFSKLYNSPFIIWIICPILMYWVSRIWFIAQRGDLHYDPVYFVAKDKISLIVVIVIASCFLAAKMY